VSAIQEAGASFPGFLVGEGRAEIILSNFKGDRTILTIVQYFLSSLDILTPKLK
jgi:hypothetical protein